MKKFSAYIFIGILALGIFTPFKEVLANSGTCTWVVTRGQNTETKNANTESREQCLALAARDGVTSAVFTPTGGGGGESVGDVSNPINGDEGGCSMWSTAGIIECFFALLEPLGNLIITIAAFFLGLAGWLLDFVLTETIVNMSANIKKFAGINTVWELVRDLINIVFIFILIWEGIKMIIGLSSTDYVKKFIGFLVLASLLVNFSLFFTKVMVDASNAVTIGLYNAISTQETSAVPIEDNENMKVGNLAGQYMKSLGLTNFYSGATFQGTIGGSNQGQFIILILGSVLFVITAFVFFAVSMLFIIRYITVLVLLMLSPVAFMGMALQPIKGYSNEWWNSLRGQLIFPPVYMFMNFVVLTLISSEGFIVSNESGAVVAGEQSSISLVFNFIIIIGLALFTLITAKKTASEGSSMIGQATGMLNSFAGKALLGTSAAVTSWGMRKTIGARALRESENEDLKARAAAGDKRAQARLATARKLASSSFDIRATSGLQKVAKATGVDLGKGSIFNEKAGVGGYKKHLEQKTDAEKKYIESLKPSDAWKDEEKKRINQEHEEVKNRAEEQNKVVQDKEIEFNKKLEEMEGAEGTLLYATLEAEVRKLDAELALEKEKQRKLNEEEMKSLSATKDALKDVDDNGEYKRRAENYARSIENPKAARLAVEKEKADKDVSDKRALISDKEKEKQELTDRLNIPGAKDTPEGRRISEQIKALDNEISRENKNLEGLVQVQTEATEKHTKALEKGSKSILEAAKNLATVGAGGVVGAVTGGIAGIPFGLPGILVGAGAGGVAGARASRTVSKEERSQIADAVRKKPGEKKSDRPNAKEMKKLGKKARNEELPMSEREEAAKKMGYSSLKAFLGEEDDDDE